MEVFQDAHPDLLVTAGIGEDTIEPQFYSVSIDDLYTALSFTANFQVTLGDGSKLSDQCVFQLWVNGKYTYI